MSSLLRDSGATGDLLKQMLERCLVDNDEVSWSKLLASIEELVRRTFFSMNGDGSLKYSDFVNWFPGWLYEQKKLNSLYRALEAGAASGEVPPNAENSYARNYFVRIVRSAVGDWYRQNHLPPPPDELIASSIPSAVTPRIASVEEVQSVLLLLKPELRVPFWLRHYQALGGLSQVDLAWLARSAAMTVIQVEALIDQETCAISPRPLSSEFIGGLLQLPPLSNGKSASVDQRIRRARDLVRQYLYDQGASDQ